MFNVFHKSGPCLGCDERFPGCHSKCVKYKKWRSEWLHKSIKINKAKHDNKMYADYHARAIDNFKKDNRLSGYKMRRHINGK